MIEILHYEKANKGKVIGFLDIKLSLNKVTMIIRKIAHCQNGERRWFNLPTFTREGFEGQTKFLRYWQFDLDVHNGQLLEALPEKVKEFCQKNNIEEATPLDFSSAQISETADLPF